MSVPLLQQGSLAIASLQSDMTDSELHAVREQLLARVGASRVTGAIIDVSSLDMIDSYAARSLSDVAAALKLRGCRTAVVGIQPEVAMVMAGLGLALRGAITTLDLDSAVDALTPRRSELPRVL